MINRYELSYSFKINAQLPKVDKTPVKRRSCECSECGLVNKKMQYIGSIIEKFQPYVNFAQKLFENEKKHLEKQSKIQQQKQIRLRNKRHNHNKDMLKKAVNAITFQEVLTKPKKITELPPITPCSLKEIHHKQQINQLATVPQRKMWDKRQTTIKFQYQSSNTLGQKYCLPATPLDQYLVARINKVIYQQYTLTHQQGTVDDFKFKLRMNIFDDKQEQQTIKHHHFIPPPIRQEESYDEGESMESVQQIPIKIKPNREETYKQILKYNKRSFANLIEKAQLSERKTIQNLIKINNRHRLLPLPVEQQPLPIFMIQSNFLDSYKSQNVIKIDNHMPQTTKSISQHCRIQAQNKHKKNFTAVSILFRV